MALKEKQGGMLTPIPALHKVRAACEPQDTDFWVRYSELGGRKEFERRDQLIAIRVLSSLEDDLEMTPRPDSHKRVQAQAMRRVRRSLELCVGDERGKAVGVRKTFPLAQTYKNKP